MFKGLRERWLYAPASAQPPPPLHSPFNPHPSLSKDLIKAVDFLQPFNDMPYNVIS